MRGIYLLMCLLCDLMYCRGHPQFPAILNSGHAVPYRHDAVGSVMAMGTLGDMAAILNSGVVTVRKSEAVVSS